MGSKGKRRVECSLLPSLGLLLFFSLHPVRARTEKARKTHSLDSTFPPSRTPAPSVCSFVAGRGGQEAVGFRCWFGQSVSLLSDSLPLSFVCWCVGRFSLSEQGHPIRRVGMSSCLRVGRRGMCVDKLFALLRAATFRTNEST